MQYIGYAGRYNYAVLTDRAFPRDQRLTVFFDSDTGEFAGLFQTSAPHMGETITNWLEALHMIRDPVDYLAYRIFVAVIGLVIVMLSVTGVYIWWKKRPFPSLDRVRKPRSKGRRRSHHAPPSVNVERSATPSTLSSASGGGVDGVTWKDYEADLERRLEDLHAKSTGSLSPPAGAAVHIQGGRGRGPCGAALGQDRPERGRYGLNAVYERFPRFSYGFVPTRPHDALDALATAIEPQGELHRDAEYAPRELASRLALSRAALSKRARTRAPCRKGRHERGFSARGPA